MVIEQHSKLVNIPEVAEVAEVGVALSLTVDRGPVASSVSLATMSVSVLL